MLFKSKTILSIMVRTGKGTAHVAFDPVSTGGSTFRTYNEELIEGMKKHPKYGKTFFTVEEPKPEPSPVAAEAVPDEEPEVKVIRVDDAEDAKEYLVDKFGVSRTQIRSIVKIKEFASKYGIEFEGI